MFFVIFNTFSGLICCAKLGCMIDWICVIVLFFLTCFPGRTASKGTCMCGVNKMEKTLLLSLLSLYLSRVLTKVDGIIHT